MKRVSCFSVFFLINLFAIFAQADTALAKLLLENTYELNIDDNQFIGTGAEVLESAINGTQFIMIGEQHGIVEVGQVAEMLFKAAKPYGYQYMALEVSPFIADKIQSSISTSSEALLEFNRELPNSIPFYNNIDDLSMLEEAIKNNGKIWGLDQVFIIEVRYIFSELLKLAPNTETEEIVGQYLRTAKETLKAAFDSGKFNEVMLFKLQDSDFNKLNDLFSESAQALDILNKLNKTQEIYKAWGEGRGYDNNLLRITQMKSNFYTYYREALKKESVPKVLFKFGSGHMARGLSYFNMYDLGNLAHEIAIQNDLQSLHIKVEGIKGEYYNSMRGLQSFNDFDDLDDNVKYVLDHKEKTENWYLIDLRPARQLRLKHLNIESKSLIFGYDFYLLIPNTQALTAME